MATTLFGINLNHIRKNMGNALSYWAAAMNSVLPKFMQRRLIVGQEQLLIHLTAERVYLRQRINDVIKELASFDRAGDWIDESLIKQVKNNLSHDDDLLLIIDDSAVLSKALDFPAAVADNLRQAVWYEMDKHTPFPKDQVLFDIGSELGSWLGGGFFLWGATWCRRSI